MLRPGWRRNGFHLGHTWPMGYCCSLWCLSVFLSIQFLLAYIYITDIKPSLHIYNAQYLFPYTSILALRPLTLAWWLWPWLCLLPQNYLNQKTHECQNGTFAACNQYLRWVGRAVTLVDRWSTFQGYIGHHDLGLCLLMQYCLNKTSHQCQSGTFGEFYQYLWWVLTFDLLFKIR